MTSKSKVSYLFACIPFLTLVFAIPFVNRVEPMVWGMPFLLWWIVFNVLITPVWLGLAYWAEKNAAKTAYANQGVHGGDPK